MLDNKNFLILKEKIKLNSFFMEPAIYVHVPFCENKCLYCDFYSIKKSLAKNFLNVENSKNKTSKFVEKILSDIFDLSKLFNVEKFSSVYIGGGTPSTLSGEDIFLLSSKLSKKKNPQAEFTVELNPESASSDFIEAAIAGGVNRFSLGVQTFSDSILENQNRLATSTQINNALKNLKLAQEKYGIKISCDLIVGFENQTPEQVVYDVQTLINQNINHISVYTLCTSNYKADIENDLANFLFDVAEKTLLKANFFRYEISNFAKSKSDESEHNKAYWNLKNYFGVGPSAVGTIVFANEKTTQDFPFAIRTNSFKNLQAWYENNFPYEIEILSRVDCIKDFILMGLRLKDGIDKKIFFSIFQISFDLLLKKTILKYKNFIFLNTDTNFSLTEKGLNFLSQFLVDAFLEIEKTIH